MKRHTIAVLALLSIVLAGASFAQTKAAAPSRVGFVDSNRAVLSTKEGQAEYQKITEWLKKQDEQLQDLQKQLNDKQTQYQNQQNMLSEDKKEEAIKEIDRIDTTIKRRTEDIKKEYARRMDEFSKLMDKKIGPLFQKFAKDNNYSAIFYLNPQILAYFDETSDVTDAIIQLYDQTFPYTAAQQPATAKPANK